MVGQYLRTARRDPPPGTRWITNRRRCATSTRSDPFASSARVVRSATLPAAVLRPPLRHARLHSRALQGDLRRATPHPRRGSRDRSSRRSTDHLVTTRPGSTRGATSPCEDHLRHVLAAGQGPPGGHGPPTVARGDRERPAARL